MSDVQKNRTNVKIYGTEYVIVGQESSNHVRLVASIVDKKMREINGKNTSLDLNKLAVLTAVNIVNDYIKLIDRVEELENELNREKG
ncbi:cell division protein ZapA [Niallia taxi]|uniref:Cell division protein ZapA n=2 Tax=Niallia TaxID=2837506 RepID=A0A437KD02_9BACI|nr:MULTISPECIES: cell division protein ZapA [Niallia]MCM3215126.1 cell division protein ZapA [Niallia taxi]MDK8639427.1 cell division protein ZapA [Niallia taxi]MED4037542.1 cell division protein ZapA [Niallia taxi]MED4057523.1 cell division protein ZapA [Niallia taxi]MED4117984.1 cell division protein ZapA [Niallia taxi]